MLLTISTTHQPAIDLGYLLCKHPGRCQAFDPAFGKAHAFYPEAAPAFHGNDGPIIMLDRSHGSTGEAVELNLPRRTVAARRIEGCNRDG
jgi:hypothetical protein